jgi:hypothetical protein
VQQKFISGARFGFVLDEELKEAASDEEVRSALANKISRERIGHEVIFYCVIFLLSYIFKGDFREILKRLACTCIELFGSLI